MPDKESEAQDRPLFICALTAALIIISIVEQ